MARGGGKQAIMERAIAEWKRANPDGIVLVVKPGDCQPQIAPEPRAIFYDFPTMPIETFERLSFGRFHPGTLK